MNPQVRSGDSRLDPVGQLGIHGSGLYQTRDLNVPDSGCVGHRAGKFSFWLQGSYVLVTEWPPGLGSCNLII